MKRLTLSYGIIGAAVAVVAMALMMGNASLTAYAQNTTNSTTGTAMTANSTNATANATGTAAAANGGPVILNMTSYINGVDVVTPLSAGNIQYQKTDEAFAKLAQTTYDCLQEHNQIMRGSEANPTVSYLMSDEYVQGSNKQVSCINTVSQGIQYFCDASDFVNYDMARCEEARMMSGEYLGLAQFVYGQ